MLQRRYLIGVGLLVPACLAAYWLLQPRPILVEVATVKDQPFTAIVEEDGRTRVRDRFVVSAPLSGRVPRSLLRAGDVVKTGQTLATITPNISPLLDSRVRQELQERVGTAEASLEEAKAMHERAKVLLSRARTDLDRTTQLKGRGVATVAQLEHDTFTFQAAERDEAASARRLHAAEHALDQARAALTRSGENEGAEQFAVTSPIEGRVLKVIQESEAVVSLGAPLVELGDPADLEVIVDLLTTDAALVREEAKVLLERWVARCRSKVACGVSSRQASPRSRHWASRSSASGSSSISCRRAKHGGTLATVIESMSGLSSTTWTRRR